MARRAEPVRAPKPVPRLERVAAFRLGLSAESRAALLLIAEAYRIGVPVIVEVKAAVTERSKRRIVGAAELRRARHPQSRQRRNPFRRYRRHAGHDAAPHRQCLRCPRINGPHYISTAQFDGKISMRNVTSPTLTPPNATSPV